MGHPPRIPTAGLFACLLLFYFSPAFATKSCTVGCHGLQSGKAYQEGQTYVYDLEGSSITSVTDAQGEATLKLKASVELTVKPNCLRQLRLKNVQVNGAPVQLKDIEQHALQFNYHDGHIDTEVCAEPGDSQSSLNVKRAVASLFQSAVFQDSGSTTHHETDIFGGCVTDFNFQKDGDSLVVNKHRNLIHCSNRESIRHGLISAVYDPYASIQSIPLLSAHHKAEQRFKQGILNKAVSIETYKYQPFSNGEAAARTVVETVLTFKSQKGDVPDATVSVPKSLLFEAPHPVVKSSSEAIVNALKAVKDEETSEGVKPFAARRVAELVKVLRSSNKKDILSVYHRVKAGAGFDKVSDKKILLDALFRAGTGEAAEVAVELIKNKELSEIQTLFYYASLTFVRHVNLPSVTAMTTLLDQLDLPRVGYLGVGQIIGKYCQEHDCENVPEINKAVSQIVAKVGNGKAETRQKEDEIIAALKALGNTRYIDDENLTKLAAIASDKKIRNRVRVAVIEALPARCSKVWKNSLYLVLADREEDSEIRIKTYLSLVACACPHVANKVKEVLDKETVNQVGSFITTHLRNLRASADPNKLEAKEQLSQIKPRIKFPEDFRKFSFNNEFSYYMEAFGIGDSIESNVIYSQNSWVPRSVSLNFTTEMFGRSFNFLELNGRVENLDRVIEHYFGPKGEFMSHDVKDLTNDGKNRFNKLAQHIKDRFEKMRAKREVKHTDLDKFAKNVQLRGNEVDEHVDLDLSVKLFGVELGFLSLEGSTDKYTPQYIVDKIFDTLGKGMDRVKDFNYNIENHLQFLDGEYVYPTGLGLPMTLGIVGTSVVHIKTNGKLDIPAMFKDPKNAFMKLALEPSLSVRFAAHFTVEGFGVESGLKVITTLHSSTGSDVTVKLLDGKGIDINFGIPKKVQELISITSEVLVSSGPKGDEYIAPKFGKGREHSDCFDQFSSLLGLTICGHISYPYDSIESMQKKPFFPLSGPAKFAITIENNDVTSYHFKMHFDTTNSKARTFEVLLETPKSRTNRKLSLLIEAAIEPDKYGKISFDSPLKTASVEARLKNTQQERTLTFTVLNDQNEYFFRLGLLANGNKYKPVLEYKVPEHVERLASSKTGAKSGQGQLYNVDGSVDVSDFEGGKKFTFENVVLKASGRDVASLDGTITSIPNAIGVDANLSYGPEKIALKVDGKRKKDMHYSLDVTAKPTKNPEIGFSLQYEVEQQKTQYNQKLVLSHGPDFANRFTWTEQMNLNLDPQNFVIGYYCENSYPPMGYLLKLKGEATRKSIEGDVEFKYDKFKFGTEFSAKTGIAKPGDYEVEFEAQVLQNKIELKSKREILGDHKSKFTNSLELSPGGKYEADVILIYDIKDNYIDVHMDGDVNLNGKKVKIDTGLESKPQKLNSKAMVTLNDDKYLDFLLKIERGDKPNGNLNLNLKNYLTAVGEFSYQSGKGSAHVTVDIPKINRKIKGTSDITITGTQHMANLELLYDVDKDPSKKLKLITVSDITKTSIDTKNVLEMLSYKLEVNAKGKMQGKPFIDGQINGEVDVTLPNGRYVVAKGKYNVARKGNKMDYQPEFELIDHVKKGGESQKLTYSGEGKDVDIKSMTYKCKHNIKYVFFDGNNIELGVVLKNIEAQDPEKKNFESKVTLTGSVMPRPFSLEANSDYGQEEGSWDVKSSLGDDISMKTNGKYAHGDYVAKPHMIDGVLEMKLPSDKLKNLKIEMHESLLIPSEIDGRLELTHKSTIIYNDDKKITMDADIKHFGFIAVQHPSEGSCNIALGVLDKAPYGIESYYIYNPSKDKMNTLTFGMKLTPVDVAGDFEISRSPDWSALQLKVKGNTHLQSFNTFDMDFKHKNENDNKLRKTDISLTVDNKKYGLNSEIKSDLISPSIDVTITIPEGKTEIKAKTNKVGDREFTGAYSIKGPKGFVTLDGHVKLESEDDFMIEVDIDSNKMKQRKIHAEVASSANAKAGKRIHVTVTSDGKNLLSGSMNFNKREEDGKIIIDGSGQLKVMEATRSSSFKYSRQSLTKEVHGESGIFCTLHANFDPSAVVSEFKFTNKEALFFGSYCEKSKDCTQMKLHSKLDTDKKTKLHHQVTVEANLRKLNVPLEFGFRSNMKYEKFSYDHVANLYLHSTREKSEYGYHAYANIKESGFVFSTPNRELALISSHDMPKSKHTGAYKMETALYLDRKNKPNDKTSVMVNGDVNIEKNMLSVNGEAKLIYPSQPKDMIVKGRLHCGGDNLIDANVDIDLFAKKAQKINIVAKLMRSAIPKGYNITGNVEFNSRGQQLKVDLKEHLALSQTEIGFGSMLSYTDIKQKPKSVGMLFSVNLKEAHLLVQALNKELLKSDSTIELSKNMQKVDTEFKILDNKPQVVNFEAKDFNNFKFIYSSKDSPNDKFMANGRIVLGQLAEFHADNYAKGDKKNLFSMLVHLDESNFLKPDFSYDKDNIVNVMVHYRNQLIDHLKQLKDVSKEVMDEVVTELKDLFEHLKKAQPNLKPLIEYYQAELKKLKEELHADATVQEIEAVLKKTFGTLFEAIAESAKHLALRFEELHKQLHDMSSKLIDAFKATYPHIKNSLDKIMKSGLQVLEAISNLGVAYFKAILNIINEHQKELKEIITVASELAQDVAKIVFKAMSQVEKDVKDFITLLVQQLKALPIYDIIKEKYQEALNFQIPETILAPIHELVDNLKNILPTKELRELFEITHEYIMKLIRRQKVDDTNELKKIYSHAVTAVQSIIELLQNRMTFDSVIDLFDTKISTDFSFFKKLPGLATLKVSLFNLLMNRELPTPMDVYYAFRPTLHLDDIIPPFSMAATITDGGHIFTFDGRHLTLPGSCNYILAQDFQDGNFSVVAELNNGKLMSVTVTDPKESITIKPNSNILYNNKPSDLPLNTENKEKNLHAYLVIPSVNVRSSYGVHLICSDFEHFLCQLHVSGFYLGKLRGLFGDGNNEPYDDFTVPSGKIAETDTEFANAYKLNPSCPDATATKHDSAPRAPVCTDYFSGYSSMSRCFNYVTPSHYRVACDHAVAAGTTKGACLVATAYFAACREKRVFVNIPSACGKCKVGPNDMDIGNTFNVKIPKKEADVIFVVEQETNNEKVYKELVVPLISELKNELKNHGMTDVFTGLIGFSEKMKWPQHYTSNGNKNVDSEAKNMEFLKADPQLTFQDAKAGNYKDKLKYVKQRADIEFGTFQITNAYEQAVGYPFRPGAAKAVVGVLSTVCEKSILPISLQHLRLLLGQKKYRDMGLTYFHMFNSGEIMISGKEQKNIVGYDYDSAYTFADSKKKPLEGSTATKNNLMLTNNDVCAGFALTSGGAAFSTHNFLEAKPNQKKQFIQIAARRIAEGLAYFEFQEDCTCYQYHGIVGRSCCKIVNRKEKELRPGKVKG